MSMEIIRIINGEQHTHNKHYVYAHIMEDEQHPFYIGIGTQQTNNGFYSRAKNKTGRNLLWKERTKNKKYYVIICSSSNDYELIKQQEVECINEMREFNNDPNSFVNIAAGGAGCLGYKHTEEHKQWLKENYSGDKNPMFGKTPSLGTRQKMSQSQTGRKHKQESIELMRVKKLQLGYLGPKGSLHHKSRKVYEIDINSFNIISEYPFIKEAAKEVGCTDKAIGKACKNFLKIKGYYWSYDKNINVKNFQKENKTKISLLKNDIVRDHNDNISVLNICKKYNISETHCRRILKLQKNGC